jgi:anti-anti-sigma factor
LGRASQHPGLEIISEEEPDVIRLVVRGELDRNNAWALSEAVIRSRDARASRLVLDLSAVEFIDAGGLRALREAARLARRQRRRLVLDGPSANVVRLLRVTRLDEAFEIDAGTSQ